MAIGSGKMSDGSQRALDITQSSGICKVIILVSDNIGGTHQSYRGRIAEYKAHRIKSGKDRRMIHHIVIIERAKSELAFKALPQFILAVRGGGVLICIKIQISHRIRNDDTFGYELLKLPLYADLEGIIKVALFSLLVSKNALMNTILVNNNAELMRPVE